MKHVIITLLILACASVGAQDYCDWDCHLPYTEYREIWPTYPGTEIPDYTRPGYLSERRISPLTGRVTEESVYPTHPGTMIPDYTRPGYTIDYR